MSSLQYLRQLINQRLTAAAEEIFGAFEEIIVEYEEEVDRQRKLLEIVWKPDVKLQRIDPSQQEVAEAVPDEQHLWNQGSSSNPEQVEVESLQIKEEEFCVSPEDVQLVVKQEVDTLEVTPPEESAPTETDHAHQLLPPAATSTRHQTPRAPRHADDEKPYSCDTCGRHFVSKSNLVIHIRTHTGEKPFPCSICGKHFRASTNLTKHLKTHTGEKPHSCSICGKKFNASTNLTKHMRIHTGEKPYCCTVCGKRFNASTNLTNHMRTHTGEKPYACSVCGRKFNSSYILKTHMRTHTGEKPYSCTVCGNCFSRKDALMVHMRTHTGERPYSCNICEKCFIHKGALLQHMMTHQVISIKNVQNNQASSSS